MKLIEGKTYWVNDLENDYCGPAKYRGMAENLYIFSVPVFPNLLGFTRQRFLKTEFEEIS